MNVINEKCVAGVKEGESLSSEDKGEQVRRRCEEISVDQRLGRAQSGYEGVDMILVLQFPPLWAEAGRLLVH